MSSITTPPPLTTTEALSGITGTISLAAWIFLLLPQLYENYAQGHADGISLAFLLIWALGDVTNLAGAVWAGLVPTVVALAVYFTAADCVLIGQCFWYRWAGKRKDDGEANEGGGKVNGLGAHEETPLLRENAANGHATGNPQQKKRRRSSLLEITDDNLGLPGSHTRRRSSGGSTARNRPQQHNRTHSTSDSLTPIPEQQQQDSSPSATRETLKNTLSILLIILAGTAAWFLAYKTGAWTPHPPPNSSSSPDNATDPSTPLGATLLGYISAIAYLGARIPQILKNQRERSCEGLSLLFFLLSLMGNATYGAGILFHSLERGYVVTNLPWLIGSLGTMVEDAVIFAQFHAFGGDQKAGSKGGVREGVDGDGDGDAGE